MPCQYRIQLGGKFVCGKNAFLPCRANICPFGPERWPLLVKNDKQARKYWLVKRGKTEKVEELEDVVKAVKRGEADYVMKQITYRRAGRRRGSDRTRGTFMDAMRLTRFADLQLSGEEGKNAKIAIIDSGAAADAPSAERIVIDSGGSVLDEEEHGEHIHRIIHRLAPRASIYVVKIETEDVPDHLLINALRKTVELGVHAVNLSIQSEYPSDGEDPVSIFINHMSQKAVVTSVSAGNGGPRPFSIGSPGAAAWALTVGGVDVNGKILSWSSRGPTLDGRFKPDIVAPAMFRFEDALLQGTSYAAPFAAALAGILVRDIGHGRMAHRMICLSASPLPLSFTWASRSSLIEKLSKKFPKLRPSLLDIRNTMGSGVLNAAQAVEWTHEFQENKASIMEMNK